MNTSTGPAYGRRKRLAYRARITFFGGNRKSGLLARVALYALLAGTGFVYLYPLLYMLVNSFMSTADLVDPSVSWIPTALTLDNFRQALIVLDYFKSLMWSVIMSAAPAVLQMVSLAIISYGLARYPIPFKKLWYVVIVAAFIIPSSVTMIPKYVMFESYGFINTVLPSYVPALLGQGLRGSIFILIFTQFYASYPVALDEAASIDGAGTVKVFLRVAIPMVRTALLVTFLFSFIWYWNETLQAGTYFGSSIQTLPMKLKNYEDSYRQFFIANDFSTANRINESIRLAGTLLTILPLITLYIFLQRQFIEGIERSGITGE